MNQFKKTVSLITIIGLFTCSSLPAPAQFNSDSAGKWIREINTECARINTDTTKFMVTEKDVFGQSSEGGFLRLYSEGNVLRKAILSLFGENGQVTNEYYLVNGQLIFLFQKGMRYKQPINEGKTEIQSKDEDRFYFRNKKLVLWYTTDDRIVSSSLYATKEKEILADFKNIL